MHRWNGQDSHSKAPILANAAFPACRLPGGVRSPSDLWDFLANNRSAQGPVPSDRFNIKAFYHPDGNRAGAMNADGGYFLQEDVRQFDNSFFGINNLEATYMDPQQRKLLEVVYECFESAGLSMDSVAGANIGVYVGNFTVDYLMMQARDVDYLHRYGSTGSGTAIMANRISHVFNLHGPSFVLDTACSSSIYCLHNAVNAIRSGECDGAIVAGANLITSPEQHIGTAKSGVLSPTSTCHTFDARQMGDGRAEAVSTVYLKRLSAALRDKDKVWAVIRGTAINANGKTPGITQPSSKFQEAVIRKAYRNAGLKFSDTDYIECHGTGTAVGDPMEVEGLQNCFSPRDRPLKIGSVKTNLGHSEAASGLTSLLKVALSFHNAQIPPSHGITKLNPKLKLQKANMSVPTDIEEWPRALRRASINSFGYGGANAHCILESVDSYLHQLPATLESIVSPEDQLVVLPVSAMSMKSLEARVQETKQAVQRGRHNLQSLAYTLSQHRPSLRTRGFIVAKDHSNHKSEVLQSEVIEVFNTDSIDLPFAFVFTGQGAQYAGTGQETKPLFLRKFHILWTPNTLYIFEQTSTYAIVVVARELIYNDKTFADTIRKLDDVLQDLPPETVPAWTLEQTILDSPEVSQINNPIRSQPICTAVQIGLVDMLRTWNVIPSATVGHSSGEIGAAYAANLLTAKEAILAAYFRGLAVGKITSRGAMVAAKLSPETARDFIENNNLRGQICVACVNSPESVTLSGTQEAAEIALSELKKSNTFARKLETGGRAYHSHLIREIGELYEGLLAPYLEPRASTAKKTIKMFSSVGPHKPNAMLRGDQAGTALYWRKNLERSVQFASALGDLINSGSYHLVEIGPHSALKGPIQQIQKALNLKHNLPYSSSLVRSEDADLTMKKLAGTLYCFGHTLDWGAINNLSPQSQIIECGIAPYPWDYSSGLLWNEPRPSIELRNRKHLRHELLGTLQPAGSSIDWMWRNILQLNEVPWLSEHMVESQVVFPAVAYIAMAMEAVSQARGLKDPYTGEYAKQNTTFELRNVSFGAALVVQDEKNPRTKDLELHTRLSWRKLSTTSTSADWCEFEISSWGEDLSVLHCSGKIRTTDPIDQNDTTVVSDTAGFETQGMERWYNKLTDEGIIFGPNFQALTSLSTDSTRVRRDATATTKLRRTVGKDTDTEYPIHPVVIDAVMQCGVMGGTGGNVDILKVHLPIFLSECRIQVASQAINEEAIISSACTRTSVSTVRVNSTLKDIKGTPVVDMKDLRLSMYTGKMAKKFNESLQLQRHPTLRVTWKPDILRVSTQVQSQIEAYISEFTKKQTSGLIEDETVGVVGTLIDLIGHNNPRMRILEIETECQCRKNSWHNLLDMKTALPRCLSWHRGGLTETGELEIQEESAKIFDGLVIFTRAASEKIWKQVPDKVLSLLDDYGVIITRKTEAAIAALRNANLEVMTIQGDILFARRPLQLKTLEKKHVIVITKGPSSATQDLAQSLINYLQQRAGASSTVCISLLEVEREFLATISPQDMDLLRKVTDVTRNLLWLTGADMLRNPNPDLTLSGGLSRALMLEQPSLRWSILDIGSIENLGHLEVTCENVVKALTIYEHLDDKEFIQVDGLLYTSRFRADFEVNELFRRRVGEQAPLKKTALSSSGQCRLAVERPGATDTLHFQQVCEPSTPVPPGFIDVAVKATNINAKDISTMNGQTETRAGTVSLEFAGIVMTVGPDVTDLKPGDRVIVMAPNYLNTLERVPAWAAHKMLPDEKFDVLCTIPMVWTTALYALRNRGNLRAGESVLIHSGAGSVGSAAITLALSMGATVYTTVNSQAKRDFVINELGVPSSNIFSSRDDTFVKGLKDATSGRGVDLVLNSLVGDLMHESWECLAAFGRFVEIGRRELAVAGRLEMHNFLRNTTFTSFDMMDLFYHEDRFYRDLWTSLTKEVLEMYRCGHVIKTGPISKFDVANIPQAFQNYSMKDRIGKVVLTLEKPDSQIQIAPSKYLTILDPQKVYLMVGCLGGLGRSLSRWMMARGARYFVFLGRSGCDKPDARDLVNRLEQNGAIVTVVRGDVSNSSDVKSAVQACVATNKSIGGVIQAAMGLHEALFSTMTNEAWHTGIQPKWRGTWNLHHALQGYEDALDFFFLTSSVSGSVATATESNYCSANGFLDAFARWRRSRGKKAVSVGFGMIAEVGYLHENSEIGALLLRKGLQALSEEEFLHVTDLALSGVGGEYETHTPDTSLEFSHLLTGLEPMGLRKLIAQGWDVTSGNMQDPRTSILSAALVADRDNDTGADTQAAITGAPEWLKVLPKSVAPSFASETGAASLLDAVVSITRRRFSSLILTPLDQIDNRKPLAQFGMDSMIGAEFRTWIWGTFKVDIPFLDLLSNQKALINIAENIEANIGES
ncbi:hypothetical protein NUW58_g15 [Xylaria curta]|uniref:Uncharacterized protein n=1 Tax=Xylaria curta TaxID=42375 RepID=A0ACC1PSL4_9PEZI|nr:hypothetical protein NUW58_g15 [Xylaria curta]